MEEVGTSLGKRYVQQNAVAQAALEESLRQEHYVEGIKFDDGWMLPYELVV